MPSRDGAVHPPQVAGMFYPAAPDALNTLIADVRTRARPDGGVSPKVVIAPHAGLAYSGAVAATAFGPWARRAKPPRRIVIIGPRSSRRVFGRRDSPGVEVAHAAG
jgi:AmmeMemoRadiSam system protein B